MILMLSRTGLGIWAHMNLPRKYNDERWQCMAEEKKKVKASGKKEKTKSMRHRGREGGWERRQKPVR